MNINIAIGGGRKLLREGLSLLLDKHPNLRVIAESADVSSLPKLVRTLPVDVVVLNDSSGAGVSGEEVRAIRRAKETARIVVLALNPPVQWVQSILASGATGCLTKECAATELVSAILSA